MSETVSAPEINGVAEASGGDDSPSVHGDGRITGTDISAGSTDSETNSKTIRDLMRTREWLQTQLIEYQTEVQAAENANSWILPEDPDKVVEKMTEQQNELQSANIDLMLKQLMLKRVQQGNTLMQHLFPADRGSGDTVETSGEQKKQQQKLLTDLVSKQTALTSQILQIHEENQEKMKQIDQLHIDNLDLKHSVRELMYNLQKVKETDPETQTQASAQNQALATAQDKLRYATEKTELIRHIFQGLILGSGVNWVQDPELTELLLGLGKPLDTQV